MDLGVAALEGDVGEGLLGGDAPGELQHRGRQVDPDDLAPPGVARGDPGGLTGAAADVEHAVALGDAGAGEQVLVGGLGHPIEVSVMFGPASAFLAVPRVLLGDVDRGRHQDASAS
ncbi:hypothetical protein GCM10027161_76200 [Microbispora hainanensis]|nr:hypothetical protein [Microbispora hainanensis]